jgi:hypothetical protein
MAAKRNRQCMLYEGWQLLPAIVWLRNFKHTNNRLLRWSLRLQENDIEIIYKKGSQTYAANCMSRRSYPPTEQLYEGWQLLPDKIQMLPQ